MDPVIGELDPVTTFTGEVLVGDYFAGKIDPLGEKRWRPVVKIIFLVINITQVIFFWYVKSKTTTGVSFRCRPDNLHIYQVLDFKRDSRRIGSGGFVTGRGRSRSRRGRRCGWQRGCGDGGLVARR